MRYRTSLLAPPLVVSCIGGLYASQMPFRESPAIEYYNFPKPPDWREKSEWVFGKLTYPSVVNCARWTMDCHPMREHDGYEPRWRGIYDDIGRLMAAICPNMDLGDSREHAGNLSTPKGSPRLDSESASTTSFMQ